MHCEEAMVVIEESVLQKFEAKVRIAHVVVILGTKMSYRLEELIPEAEEARVVEPSVQQVGY